MKKNRNEKRRWPQLSRRRRLWMRVMDLKSFFIKVPRVEFGECLRDVQRRIQERWPGKGYF